MKASPELPRLLAFDLDGTLLPMSKKVTAYTRRVLDRLRARGVQITVATGKFHHLAAIYGEELELDLPQISHDGAIVGGNGHQQVYRGIDGDVARDLVERFQSQAVHAFADDGADRMLLREPTDAFVAATQNWADQVSHVPDLGGHIEADPAILTFYGEDQVMTEIYEETSKSHPELRVSRYWSEYLSCRRVSYQPRGIDKGSGVLDVAQRIGAQPEECMVFGDWHNDRPMFEVGAVGVAMSNAVDELKQMADYVTEVDSDQDGVARFLEEHFL